MSYSAELAAKAARAAAEAAEATRRSAEARTRSDRQFYDRLADSQALKAQQYADAARRVARRELATW